MMNKLRKLFALLLCTVLCLSLVPGAAAEETSISAKLESVLAEYPNGSTWTSSFDGGKQCYGFAKLVVYKLFGKYSDSKYRSWLYNGTSSSGMTRIDAVENCTSSNVGALLQKAKPGDVLQFDTGNTSGHQHSMIVYSVENNGAEIYECNWTKDKVTKTYLTSAQLANRQTRSDGTKRGTLSLLRSDNYPTGSSTTSDYQNTWTNTGNMAVDIAEIAYTQVGYQETETNHTKYNQWYYGNDTAAAWCATFVSWCANQAGIPQSIIHRTTYAYPGAEDFNVPYYSFGAVQPEKGDLVFVENNGNLNYGNVYGFDHVGIVYAVDSTYIYTVEGNDGNKVTYNRYRLSNGYDIDKANAYINWIGKPNYSGSQPIIVPTGTIPEKLASILSEYPDGSSWTTSFDGSKKSYGFAGLVVYKLFGNSTVSGKTYRWWTYAGVSTSGMQAVGSIDNCSEGSVRDLLLEARPGDVLQFDQGGGSGTQFSMIVYSLTNAGANIYDCNFNGDSVVRLHHMSYSDFVQFQGVGPKGKLTLLRSDNYDSIDPPIQKSILDLNGYLDNNLMWGNIDGYGMVDVYLNGVLAANSVSDYCEELPLGTEYDIRNIRTNEGSIYDGVYSGSLSGTIGSEQINVILKFRRLQNYTVNYDANGGTGAPTAQTKTEGTTLTLSSVKPTRSNSNAGSYTVTLNANGGSVSATSLSATRTTSYTFKNWNTAANGSGTNYNAGSSYTANAAATLYAQWNSSTTTAAVTLPTPTRTGYTFKGWGTSSTAASGVTGSYTPTGNVTLYAVWTPNILYMQYNSNGGIVGTNNNSFSLDSDGYILRSGKRTVSEWKYGTTYEDGLINDTSFVLSKPGYTFQGWHLGGADASAIYDQNTALNPETICPELKNGNKTITLYAVWKVSTYTITYNANGGTGAPSVQTKTYGTNLTLSNTKPTRANSSAESYTVTLDANGDSVNPASLSAARITSYTFKNWNTAANGSGTSYNAGASYTANASATLYAQWDSTTTTASVNLPTLTRAGYGFNGWATSSTAATGVTGSYTPTGNVTLYAVWIKPDLTLPAALTTIESEAFAGGGFNSVLIPPTVKSIAPDAFGDRTDLIILGTSGSYAETFAGQKHFTFIPAA